MVSNSNQKGSVWGCAPSKTAFPLGIMLFSLSFFAFLTLSFNFKDLLRKMKLPINNAPGTVFIFEEVGAIGGGAASREWQSRANSFFQSFMQTSRHRNQILLFNCPLFAFLEKGTRALVHIQITMQQINRNLKQSIGKPFIIQTNAITGKQYFKYLRYKVKEDNSMNKLGFMKFELPPKEITDVYEPMKQRYSNILDKSILEDDNNKSATVRAGRPVVPFDIEKVMDYRSKNMKNSEIADIFRISIRSLQDKVKNAKIREREKNKLISPKKQMELLRADRAYQEYIAKRVTNIDEWFEREQLQNVNYLFETLGILIDHLKYFEESKTIL